MFERRIFPAAAAFVLLAILLLILVLLWHIPMMLWDQLDLVPMVQAWQRGTLEGSGFFGMRAGHFHLLAYAMLLATTLLSHGHPWLDCVASWLWLIVYAALVFALMLRTLRWQDRAVPLLACAMIFLALYPGHLTNLQWGWQVAVFMSLAGSVVAIDFAARRELSVLNLALALLASAFAYFSFATALALVPTALVLVWLRRDSSSRQRIVASVGCVAAGLGALVLMHYYGAGDLPAHPSPFPIALYALNFIGAGVCRFAPALAPIVAFAAIASAVWIFVRGDRRSNLPWFGFVLFGVFSASIVAAARAGEYDLDQAFVTRYVSISSLFWLGWIALIATTPLARPIVQNVRLGSTALIVVFAVINASQITRKASQVAAETRLTAATLRATYPNVDRQLLRSLYFDRPELALQRLADLKALGFAPFDSPDDRR